VSLFKEKFQSDLSFFYRKQKNLIDWVGYSGGSPWQAVNIEKNDILGVEWTHRFAVGKTRLILGMERLVPVNVQEGLLSKYGLRFPDFSARVNLVQPFFMKTTLVVNYSYKQIYNTEERGHFMNLVFSVPIGNVELSLRMDNVFNTGIEEIPGLPVPGRWIYLGITYQASPSR
jgi:outer membrane cobalamin receptor